MADEKKKYTYEVTEPCFREGCYYDPTKSKGEKVLHYTDEPQVSRALKPADKVTEEATKVKAAEFAEVKRLAQVAKNPELAALHEQIALLKAQAAVPASAKK